MIYAITFPWKLSPDKNARTAAVRNLLLDLCGRYVASDEEFKTLLDDVRDKVDALNEKYPFAAKLKVTVGLYGKSGFIRVKYEKSGRSVGNVIVRPFWKYGEED